MESKEIKALAKLSKLNIDEDSIHDVTENITNLLAFVDQLQTADLSQIEPMAHPLDAVQRLRKDVVTEENRRDQFQQIAPATEEGLYLVPKVID